MNNAQLSTAQSHLSPFGGRFPICQKVDIWMIGCILYTLMFYRSATRGHGCGWHPGFGCSSSGPDPPGGYQIFRIWLRYVDLCKARTVFQTTNRKHLDV